ncbi:MAG: PEP-CTERM sorting domain-containing protein [Pirellulaceae bacterium]|nr:PEP-CTERM sorting domain-containing protein [Pirellulaceae bacterium]
MRRLSSKLVILLVVALPAIVVLPATAENIDTIYIPGLKLTFADGQIVANPTNVAAIQFMKDEEEVGFAEDDVFANILIKGVPNIPENSPDPVTTSGESGSYIDLLESDTTLLHLPVDQLNVRYTNNSGVKSVTISGIISGEITYDLSGYGLTINPNDTVSIQLVADQLTTYGDPLTGFVSTNGTGHISFTPIPEPSSLALLLSLAASALAVGVYSRRRS